MNALLARRAVRDILRDAVHSADFETDQIICRVTGSERARLHAHPEEQLSPENLSAIMELSRRRAEGEPLAYILGNSPFCGRPFITKPGVLIPRPETEILTKIAGDILKRLPKLDTNGKFADWCTGSGCIAITLLLENPGWSCWAVDSSAEAIAIARENAVFHGVDDRVKFILRKSPSAAASEIPRESLAFVVSNPPYIPTREIPSLEIQVRDHEPVEALDGGIDGLDVYRTLIAELPYFMRPGAELLLETGGADQVKEIIHMSRGARQKFNFVKKFEDQREISRFVLLKIS
jgi:release factor glutamine methyltransferase